MAEGLLRARFTQRPTGRVESAGLAALVGRPPEPYAVEVLARRGIDISAHRGRQLTPELLAGFELVLVMESAQQQAIERISTSARGRVHRIGRVGAYDVPDPYRGPREAFERAFDLIERGLDELDRIFWSSR